MGEGVGCYYGGATVVVSKGAVCVRIPAREETKGGYIGYIGIH